MEEYKIVCACCGRLLLQELIDPRETARLADEQDARLLKVDPRSDDASLQRAWQARIREAELDILPLYFRQRTEIWTEALTAAHQRMRRRRGWPA